MYKYTIFYYNYIHKRFAGLFFCSKYTSHVCIIYSEVRYSSMLCTANTAAGTLFFKWQFIIIVSYIDTHNVRIVRKNNVRKSRVKYYRVKHVFIK